MRHRSVGALLTVVCALAAVPAPARGDNGPTYVSESFRKLARKLGKQWAYGALSKACPDDKPLCRALVTGVVEAFEAIQGGETATAEQALQASFVEVTVVGASSLALPTLGDVDAALPPEDRAAAVDVLKPLLACAAQIVRDRRAGGCELTPAIAEKVKAVLRDQVLGNDQLHVDRFIDDVVAKRRPTPETVLRVLAAIASSKAIRRDDFRVYIVNLEHAVAGGLESGLYPFVERFLAAPNPQVDDIRAGRATMILATDAELAAQRGDYDQLVTGATACGAGDAIAAWNAGRAALRDRLKKQLLLGQRISDDTLRQVDALVAMKCTDAKADPTAVATLVSHGQFLRASLTMHNLDMRYGGVLLAVAAVIDQVRSPDDALFEVRVKAIAARLLAQYQGAMCTAVRVRKGDERTCVKIAEAQQPLCEIAVAKALVRGDDTLAMSACYPAIRAPVLAAGASVDTVLCKTFEAGPALGGVTPGAGGKCKVPTKDTATGAAVIDDLLGRLEALTGPIATDVVRAGRTVQELQYRLDEQERKLVQTAVRAMRLVMAQDRKGAAKVVARLAVDEIMARLHAIAKAQLGADQSGCNVEARETSIFVGDNRMCAVLLLIEAAYVPIADQIWDGGVSEKTADSIAKASYRRILESDLLAGAPVILNVGLGATVVLGESWETASGDPFSALTVIDKFGLVAYRRKGARFTFESGFFVGGFLDAIVRTIADEEHRAWLGGATLGFTRMWGYDVGVQLHGAAAMPYSFDDFAGRTGLALGATIVVPWSDYLEED